MLEIGFHDRLREIQRILNILNSRPDLLTFIYGPVNSGKTELMNYLMKTLSENFRVFYINFRGVYIDKTEDFLRVLFEIDNRPVRGVKEYVKALVKDMPNIVEGIPIPKVLFKAFFEDRCIENIFRYVEDLFEELSNRFKLVLIIDEIQKIDDIGMNSDLIYELFNLFVRLTKEPHCCHIFALTSDSLFIDRICSKAMLHGRCRFLLIDGFDYETVRGFLENYGFEEDDIKFIWNYLGGKPAYLVEAVKVKAFGGDLKDFVEDLIRIRFNQILNAVLSVEDDRILFKSILNLFEWFKDREIVNYRKLDKALTFCVKNSMIFVDPFGRVAKPQSKIDLIAMRRVLSEF